jgi:transcriptional regulator with PAS, ATPase and Fis domain
MARRCPSTVVKRLQHCETHATVPDMELRLPNKSHAQQLVEAREGVELPDLLRDLFVSQRMSKVAIAARLGVTRSTVHRWIDEFDIDPRKKLPEAA